MTKELAIEIFHAQYSLIGDFFRAGIIKSKNLYTHYRIADKVFEKNLEEAGYTGIEADKIMVQEHFEREL